LIWKYEGKVAKLMVMTCAFHPAFYLYVIEAGRIKPANHLFEICDEILLSDSVGVDLPQSAPPLCQTDFFYDCPISQGTFAILFFYWNKYFTVF
jgi:hypothetical protein